MIDWNKQYYVSSKEAEELEKQGISFDMFWSKDGYRVVYNYGKPILIADIKVLGEYRIHQQSIIKYEQLKEKVA